ncbi:hypothetical protein FB451DRAFT_1170249 [Mycena latifolia]|nr:hypothetical protein FB451DRAFT_1170249 [Mycena latifolia]
MSRPGVGRAYAAYLWPLERRPALDGEAEGTVTVQDGRAGSLERALKGGDRIEGRRGKFRLSTYYWLSQRTELVWRICREIKFAVCRVAVEFARTRWSAEGVVRFLEELNMLCLREIHELGANAANLRRKQKHPSILGLLVADEVDKATAKTDMTVLCKGRLPNRDVEAPTAKLGYRQSPAWPRGSSAPFTTRPCRASLTRNSLDLYCFFEPKVNSSELF